MISGLGCLFPAKTPGEIASRLHSETAKALQVSAVRARLAKLGVEPMPMSQPQFDAYFRADVAANARLVVAARIAKQ